MCIQLVSNLYMTYLSNMDVVKWKISNERGPKWKMTKMEDEESIRIPKLTLNLKFDFSWVSTQSRTQLQLGHSQS